jgi:hypothetical protein
VVNWGLSAACEFWRRFFTEVQTWASPSPAHIRGMMMHSIGGQKKSAAETVTFLIDKQIQLQADYRIK